MKHKTALEQLVELGIAISNLKREVLKSLCESWIIRMTCRLFGLEEVLVIQKKENKNE